MVFEASCDPQTETNMNHLFKYKTTTWTTRIEVIFFLGPSATPMAKTAAPTPPVAATLEIKRPKPSVFADASPTRPGTATGHEGHRSFRLQASWTVEHHNESNESLPE